MEFKLQVYQQRVPEPCSLFKDAPFIPSYDTIACYQWTCLPVTPNRCFFEHSFPTFFPVFAPVPTCVGTELRISMFTKINKDDEVKHEIYCLSIVLVYISKWISKLWHVLFMPYTVTQICEFWVVVEPNVAVNLPMVEAQRSKCEGHSQTWWQVPGFTSQQVKHFNPHTAAQRRMQISHTGHQN